MYIYIIIYMYIYIYIYIYIHMTISLHPFLINVLDSGSNIRQCPDQVFPALVGLYQTDVGLPYVRTTSCG